MYAYIQACYFQIIIHVIESAASSGATSSAGKAPPLKGIKAAFAQATPYTPQDTKKLKYDKLIAEMICIDLQPYTVVEKTGFQRLIKEMDPRWVLK